MNIITRSAPRTASPRSIFEELFNEPFFMLAPMNVDSGNLALDVSENESSVIVRASLPGFTKEQINVEVRDGVLTIHAERTDETEEKGEKWHRRERRFGQVARTVSLPAAVREDKANAELKDGVLTLTLPKHEKVMPKRISIN